LHLQTTGQGANPPWAARAQQKNFDHVLCACRARQMRCNLPAPSTLQLAGLGPAGTVNAVTSRERMAANNFPLVSRALPIPRACNRLVLASPATARCWHCASATVSGEHGAHPARGSLPVRNLAPLATIKPRNTSQVTTHSHAQPRPTARLRAHVRQPAATSRHLQPRTKHVTHACPVSQARLKASTQKRPASCWRAWAPPRSRHPLTALSDQGAGKVDSSPATARRPRWQTGAAQATNTQQPSANRERVGGVTYAGRRAPRRAEMQGTRAVLESEVAKIPTLESSTPIFNAVVKASKDVETHFRPLLV